MEFRKVQSVAKVVLPRGDVLSKKILDAMKTVSDIVGATLGPGGMPVLIERQEYNLPGLVTKDGVTVFKSLGFNDPIQQSVMEAARDAAVRTVVEAGDGTTTATILAESIVRFTNQYVKQNPEIPPQKVVRRLEELFRVFIQPLINSLKLTQDKVADFASWRSVLKSVAKVSANGDEELATNVMKCFDLVGDEGNITILELSGPSGYEVQRIEGFPIPIGFEESCIKFMSAFINDGSNSRVLLENPHYILYYGTITDTASVFPFLMKIAELWQGMETDSSLRIGPNIVLVATGFSESVLGSLAQNFSHPASLNVVPLLTPKSPVLNGEYHFLNDMASVTGAVVMDPLTNTFDNQTGYEEIYNVLGSSKSFEMYRFRSTVIGHADPDLVEARVEELKGQFNSAESKLDGMLIQERIGKISGGIAKLKVIGASNGELKEKRDRAEDAVCAVRGAIKHGALPGGGWTLLNIAIALSKQYKNDSIINDVLIPAFYVPVAKIFTNIGMTEDEVHAVVETIMKSINEGKTEVYDALENKFVDAFEGGILDSTPAVLEAIRNSISIASLLGTLGGVVAYPRDEEFERRESAATNDFLRNGSSTDIANEHN